jgi:predicted dehydrogenase
MTTTPSFSARFEQGAGVVQVSRVAAGHPNGLALEVFGDAGAAKWEQERAGELQLMQTRVLPAHAATVA